MVSSRVISPFSFKTNMISHMDHFTRSLTHKNKNYIFISFDAVTSKSFIQMYSVRYIHYTVRVTLYDIYGVSEFNMGL